MVGFSDASKLAYGALVYLRSESKDKVDTNLLMSKSRVAPLKVQSMPRLELLGALVLSKMSSLILDTIEIPISNVFMFSDSKTALSWIKNSQHQFKQFVEERAKTIRKNTSSDDWRHVKGNENPADLTTRVILPTELKEKEIWFKGPAWLKLPINEWPITDPGSETTLESLEEMKASDKEKLVSHTLTISLSYACDRLLNLERYSDLSRLLRVTAYIQRFIQNCKKPGSRRLGVLSAHEINESQLLWVKCVQEGMMRDGSFEQLSRDLKAYRDDQGVIRCVGRLENADNQACKISILLPKGHKLSELIVLDAHEQTLHSGVNDTMRCVREKFWIPRLRQLSRTIISRCFTCRLVDGKPYNAPPMPSLPSHRVNIEYPFSTSGVDYAGPLYVRTMEADSKGKKAYILLLTCASTRAVHLELTHDLGAPSCIRALRRFIARRGAPKQMISDNAKTFEAAEVKEFLRDRGIKWEFILPYAPWTGGFYERMVRTTKRCLKKVLKKNTLSFEELQTLLLEVETTVNNRPLTYVENESSIESLTPNHLIYGRSLPLWYHEINLPVAKDEGSPKRFRYRQKILRDFNSRWTKDYLGLLKERQKIKKTKEMRVAKLGDVVLIGDKTPRLNWKIGRIIELIVSKDGVVRGALVQVAGTKSVWRRPVVSLFPLEERAGESTSKRSNWESPLGLDPEPNFPKTKAIEKEDLNDFFKSDTIRGKGRDSFKSKTTSANSDKRERRQASINSDLKRRLLKQK